MARHLRNARTVWNDPRSVGGLVRAGLLEIWRARGGGFFGLGYVVTFVILEARIVVGEFQGADTLMSFLGDQLLEYLLRLGFMSFVNVLLAFIWPLLLLGQLGGWGILVLIIGYFGFERILRPTVEAALPELRRTTPEEEGGPADSAASQPSNGERKQP